MVLLKKIWNIVLSIVLVVAVVLALALFLPHVFGVKTYVVTSGSMEPIYPVGSIIYVKQVAPKTVVVGDAITFLMPGSNIVATHQVYDIDVQNKEFRTQGVNNRNELGEIIKDPEPVGFDAVIGKPVYCIPHLGAINRFCTTSPGCYFILCFAAACAILSFVFDTFSEPKKKNNV